MFHKLWSLFFDGNRKRTAEGSTRKPFNMAYEAVRGFDIVS